MDSGMPLPALQERELVSHPGWARAVSLILSPPLVWAVYAYVLAWESGAGSPQALAFASLYVLSICVAPMLFVAYKVRHGKISDMNMRFSRERYIPYAIAIVAGIGSELLFIQFGASFLLRLLTLVSVLQLMLMLALTILLHVSLHAMGISSVIAATAMLYGLRESLLLLPLLLLVVLARLVLRRHTAPQILMGTIIGLLTPLLVIALLGMWS